MSVLPSLGNSRPARRNRILVLAAAVTLAYIANIYGLLSGITVVFSHLLYFPIILAGYWFPRRGIVFSACMAAAYGTAALILSQTDILTMTAVISRCAIFLVIGVVVSLLSMKLSESEQKLHDIIEFLPDPTFAIDPSGNVIAWNRAIEEMTGIRKTAMIGRGNYEYALPFYGTRQPVLIDAILHESAGPAARYLNAGKESGRLEADIFLPHFRNGKGVYLRLAATALFDPGGRLAGAIESIRDVTDQVITEAALKNTGTRLNMLAGIIRNDIGKKLAVLYSKLSEAPAYSVDPGFVGWIASMRESADGIGQQIEISGAFRDIGTTPPGWMPVQDAVTAAAGRTGSDRIAFRIWTERLEVFADTHISAAFYHIFERSLKGSSNAKQVVVTYQIRQTGCAIFVEDNGRGFSDREREGLFGKRDDQFGCGLFLAKEILALTSIAIREHGIREKGIRFEILVPPEAYRVSMNGTANLPVTEAGEVSRNPVTAKTTTTRELTAGEFPLANAVWLEYHDTAGDPESDRIFAAFVEGTIVSLARCRRHPDGFEVDGVFTRDQFRHRGYSFTVVESLIEACHNDELFMYAVRGLAGFYARFGFEAVSEQDLPPSVQERYRWAAGNMEGADVQPMRRKAGL